MIFRRRKLTTRTVPPVSLILATRSEDYVAALQATRFDGPERDIVAREAMNAWVALFAAACVRAVADAESFERRVEALKSEWRERLGPVRSDASSLALLERLPSMPLVTARSVEAALGVAYTSANKAIVALENAGILTSTRVGRRNRGYEAREFIDVFTDLERQMASVDGDTEISPPTCRVPSIPARRRLR